MTKQESETRAAVAAVTLAAVHGRDHRHAGGADCMPHCTQVVHLGQRAAMVCHDCGTDSGFVDPRAAEELARRHTEATRGREPRPAA